MMSFLLGWISSSRNDELNFPKLELKIAQLILCSKCGVGDNSGGSVIAFRIPMRVRWIKGRRWWRGFTMGGEERVARMFLPAISRQEKRALGEGSRSMKEVRIWVMSSKTVQKEKMSRCTNVKQQRWKQRSGHGMRWSWDASLRFLSSLWVYMGPHLAGCSSSTVTPLFLIDPSDMQN